MAGFDDKENAPARGKGKQRRSREGGSARRLSISGPHDYLKVIAKRFLRKRGIARGRVIARSPVRFDCSPFEFSSRANSKGDKRNSFVVFEDVADSGSSKSKQPEIATKENVLTVAGSKNATLAKRRSLKAWSTGEQLVSKASAQQVSENHIPESIIASQARNKVMLSAELRPLADVANQQASGSTTSLESLAARWQRGKRGKLYTQCSLDLSELEEACRKIDEEDLEEEREEHNLEKELKESDVAKKREEQVLEKEIGEPDFKEIEEHHLVKEMQEQGVDKQVQEKDHREQEDLFVAVNDSEPQAAVIIHGEELVNVELAPEPFNNRERKTINLAIDEYEAEDDVTNSDLTTLQPTGLKEKLRLDQEVPLPESTSSILELGDSPNASNTEKDIKQLTPSARSSWTTCNIQDLDTLQHISEEFEAQLAETVEAVEVWSAELDPNRRRQENKQYHSNWHTPLPKRLILSSLHQFSETGDNKALRTPTMPVNQFDSVTQLNGGKPLSPLRSSVPFINEPASRLVEAYERVSKSTDFPPSYEIDLNGKEQDTERARFEFQTCSDHTSADEFETHSPLTCNDGEMQTWRDSKVTPRSTRSSWQDPSPMYLLRSSGQCIGSSHEKTSGISLESSPPPLVEILKEFGCVQANPFSVQASVDTSPTPPRLSCLLGTPFRQMSGEELSQRWLQFCSSPPVVSDTRAGNKKPWTIESSLTEPKYLEPTKSFPSEQVLRTTTEADVLPSVGEEAISDFLHGKSSIGEADELPDGDEDALSDVLHGKISIDEPDEFPDAGEEAISKGGHGAKTSFYEEGVFPDAEEEALSSDGPDGAMDYENDCGDVISNDTTCIVHTGVPSALNDQEGTSALKEYPQEAALSDDVRCVDLTPTRDNNFVKAVGWDGYSIAPLDEEHIDQFVNSLQVTPGLDESYAERMTTNGDSVSKDATVDHIGLSNACKAGTPSLDEELIAPSKDENGQSPQSQDECTPVKQQTRTKRSRKSTRTKKVDSPLDAGSKWSNGQRKSTRIRSKPLDWWRGERLLYGRVHSTLNTLIGIKHLSPDPVWPRPPGKRNGMAAPKFKVDSFVSDEHSELLRLAAQ